MKRLLISLLLSMSLNGFAQQLVPANLRTRISDDERTLSIQIDGNQNGRRIQFDQTFAVADMNRLRKEVLTYRAFNSVGVLPPLNAIPWLIFTGLGLLAALAAMLIVSIQRIKTALTNPMKSLRSE